MKLAPTNLFTLIMMPLKAIDKPASLLIAEYQNKLT